MAGKTTAAAAGTIDIGGDLTVNRMGYGAMRITGAGIWGDPPDREQAKAALRRARELEVNFFDTADSYGPEVSEILIAETFYPYPDDLVIATKGGLTRSGPGRWGRDGRPEHLREACEGSLRRLRLEQIPLYQFHAPDENVPLADSLGALAELKAEGKIRHVGVSNFSPEQIDEAQRIVPVVSVQNRYNVNDRSVGAGPGPVHAGESRLPALGADPGDREDRGGAHRREAPGCQRAAGRAGLAAGPVPAGPADPGIRLARARGGQHRRRWSRAHRGRVQRDHRLHRGPQLTTDHDHGVAGAPPPVIP